MIDPKSYQKAIAFLHQAVTPIGFIAAVNEQDNYQRVWTRDGVITSIAALLSGNEKLIATAKATLQTIFKNQHQIGFMPSNVSPADGGISYGGKTGRADNPSWAIIGLAAYTILTNDKSLWLSYQQQIEKCFAILEVWEFNGKHLIYVPQSGDWADEYIQHGYILFDQLLRLWALRMASKLSSNKKWEQKAIQIKNAIEVHYWKNNEQPYQQVKQINFQSNESPRNFWLMGFNPSRIYTYFDLQANTFALLMGLGNATHVKCIISYLKELFENKQSLLPSFYPTIEYADPDMNELRDNFAFQFRNQPNHFHNGGLWPVWNGWLVSALNLHGENELAKNITLYIHESNAKGNLFNECLEGVKKSPCGIPKCTWSAAGAIIAEQAIINENFKKILTIN